LAKAGTAIKVQVIGVNGRFKSPAAVAGASLPDLTAPAGRYTASWAPPSTDTLPVTFTQDSLSDDVSAAADITVAVDFGDGTPAVTDPVFPLVHDYAISSGVAKRYEPAVTVTDAAGNASAARVNAVVVFDSAAPTGAVTVAPSRGWARWTGVTLRTTARDNLSPATRIKRTVAWGDGTTTVTYGDRVLRHTYAGAGRFSPRVTMLDEAVPANSGAVTAATVVIAKDVFAPTASLSLPRAKRRVRSWTTLRGTAHDAQTAVRSVRVKAVEKRGGAFYAYVPSRHTWVEIGRRARAFAAAGYVHVATTGAWSVRLPGLRKGVLVYRAQATDVMGNVSAVYQHKQRLTKR
jgi:5'-nucleotidase